MLTARCCPQQPRGRGGDGPRSSGERAEPANSGSVGAGTEAQRRSSLASVPQGHGVPGETRRRRVDKRLLGPSSSGTSEGQKYPQPSLPSLRFQKSGHDQKVQKLNYDTKGEEQGGDGDGSGQKGRETRGLVCQVIHCSSWKPQLLGPPHTQTCSNIQAFNSCGY